MKQSRSFILNLPIFLLLLVGGAYWLYERQHYETTDDAYLKANIVLISPKVQGYVTALKIDNNQVVHRGELLVSIDDRDFRARVAQAEAQMKAKAAHIESLEAMKVVQKARIESAKADIIAAQAQREQLSKNLRRFRNLIQRGSATTQSLDNIQAKFKQATAELDSLRAHLTGEKNQLITLDAQIDETDASLKSAAALWQLAKLDLENTRVIAPVDGIIGHRGVQLGQLVRPGVTLAYLVENRNIWVAANFKETQIEFMRPGQPAVIEVDAYPDLELHGKVDSFSPASGSEFSILPPENATGNFTKIVRRVPVKITFAPDLDTHLLKPGLSAEVRVKVH